MGIFTKMGSFFKWFGGKTLWTIRKNEIVIAVSLAAKLLPIPALDKIILLVRSIDRKNKTGAEKMVEAMEKVIPLLKNYGIEIKEESDLRFLIELAVKIMKRKGRVITK